MKRIKLNENQFIKLIEASSNSAPDFTNGDLKEYPNSEVSTTANVTNSDGDLEYGKPVDTDKIQKTLAIQNFWANGRRGSRTI